ncbi:hypothetical protein KP509_25G034000 [Ceratopteris richardii]|uniref:Uncharacterized protein n=1 Tax=Ceratopteris richardii TaxID=49495 RepID=A0A8T2RQ86_CERRI|nr:hypothetical protein KP509_25G034000 [Ceratopteris richardii]
MAFLFSRFLNPSDEGRKDPSDCRSCLQEAWLMQNVPNFIVQLCIHTPRCRRDHRCTLRLTDSMTSKLYDCEHVDLTQLCNNHQRLCILLSAGSAGHWAD